MAPERKHGGNQSIRKRTQPTYKNNTRGGLEPADRQEYSYGAIISPRKHEAGNLIRQLQHYTIVTKGRQLKNTMGGSRNSYKNPVKHDADKLPVPYNTTQYQRQSRILGKTITTRLKKETISRDIDFDVI